MEPLLSRERALEAASFAVERAIGAGADEAEALLMTDVSALTRFAAGHIHQNVGEENAELRLRAVVGDRVAVAAGNQLTEEALDGLARRAVGMSRFLPPDEEFPGLPDPPHRDYEPQTTYHETTAAMDAGDRAEVVRSVLAALFAEGATGYGVATNGVSELSIANSRGVRAYQALTDGWLSVLAEREGATGWASAAGRDWSEIEAAGVDRRAVEKTRDLPVVEAAPGNYRVVLEEEAVADLLSFLGMLTLNGLAFAEGRSLFSERLGEERYPAHITITDDPTNPRSANLPFDFEGSAKRPVTLIDGGRIERVVTDRRLARRLGVANTGHALPAPDTFGPMPLNLSLEEGSARREDLIAEVENGLLVTRFHYVNTVDAPRTVLTGMTRDGTFLIEGGKVVARTQDLRWVDSIDGILERTLAVGGPARLISEGPSYGMRFMTGVLAPPLAASGFNVTGSAGPARRLPTSS